MKIYTVLFWDEDTQWVELVASKELAYDSIRCEVDNDGTYYHEGIDGQPLKLILDSYLESEDDNLDDVHPEQAGGVFFSVTLQEVTGLCSYPNCGHHS